jgi:hypothetical protein
VVRVTPGSRGLLTRPKDLPILLGLFFALDGGT